MARALYASYICYASIATKRLKAAYTIDNYFYIYSLDIRTTTCMHYYCTTGYIYINDANNNKEARGLTYIIDQQIERYSTYERYTMREAI